MSGLKEKCCNNHNVSARTPSRKQHLEHLNKTQTARMKKDKETKENISKNKRTPELTVPVGSTTLGHDKKLLLRTM